MPIGEMGLAEVQAFYAEQPRSPFEVRYPRPCCACCGAGLINHSFFADGSGYYCLCCHRVQLGVKPHNRPCGKSHRAQAVRGERVA